VRANVNTVMMRACSAVMPGIGHATVGVDPNSPETLATVTTRTRSGRERQSETDMIRSWFGWLRIEALEPLTIFPALIIGAAASRVGGALAGGGVCAPAVRIIDSGNNRVLLWEAAP
jgi:hypothetical protein